MDWNNDGLMDIITGEYDGHIRIYLNSGTRGNPVFTDFTYLQVGGTDWVCPAGTSRPVVVDWNNDGKKDVVCGGGGGSVYLLLNTGADERPIFDTASVIVYSDSRSAPAVVDWNQDGKKDLIVGGYSGNLRYYENVGTDANPAFGGYTLLTALGKTISVNGYSCPAVTDWNNDGWPDLLVGCFNPYDDNPYNDHVYYFQALRGPYVKSFVSVGEPLPGASCSLAITLTNSACLVTGLVATLSTTSAWCTVTVSNWSIGDFAPNQCLTNAAQPFAFILASNTPLGSPLIVTVDLTGDGGSYQLSRTLSLQQVPTPILSLVDVLVNDAAGDGNCSWDPGEIVQLPVKLQNTGYRAEDVIAWMAPDDPNILVLNSNTSFGAIESGAQVIGAHPSLALVAPTNAAVFSFNLYVAYRNCAQTSSFPVTLQASGGAYSMDYGSGFTNQVDSNAWVNVTLGDESYVTLPLGFDFQFYDIRTNYVHLVSNGYLTFGEPFVTRTVRAIPDTNLPNAIIAPWMEDLDPSKGGIIRYQSCGTAPYRSWVAEWLSVPEYHSTNTRSFQVSLLESSEIVFHYGTNRAPFRPRTIGVENRKGLIGTAYPGGYSTPFMDLVFYYQGGPTTQPDVDNDGLPDAWEKFYFGSLQPTAPEDADGDGLSNRAEFYCGTDPTDPNSRLNIDEVSLVPSSQICLGWRSVPGKAYSVWAAANGLNSGWTRLNSTSIAGAASGTNYFTNTVLSTEPWFFRLSIP